MRLFVTEYLQKRCCKKCSKCLKKDCGTCASCRDNSGSTSPSRQVCLFKVCVDLSICSCFCASPFLTLLQICENYSNRKYSLSIPGLTKWNFFFTTVSNNSPSENRSSLSDKRLEGLQLVADHVTNTFNRIEQAAQFEGCSKSKAREMAKDFYYSVYTLSPLLKVPT